MNRVERAKFSENFGNSFEGYRSLDFNDGFCGALATLRSLVRSETLFREPKFNCQQIWRG
jgi:hypothetical protein